MHVQNEKEPSRLHHPNKKNLELVNLETSKNQPLPFPAEAYPAVTDTDLQRNKESHLHKAKPEKAEEDAVSVLKDFGLYMRTYHGKQTDYFTMLVPSMKYFWFLPVNLTVVLDDTPEDRTFGEQIAKQFPYPTICHEKPFDSKYYHNRGHSLQQLSNFYVETCFHKKYVGFVDSDTFFVTPVTPELLFNGTKPHVIGAFVDTSGWHKATKFALGKKQVFRCMSHFPIVMQVAHIIELRQYVADLHNTSFLDVFAKFAGFKKRFSQFNIMCNYNWYFHRDKYQFHAHYVQAAKESPVVLSMNFYNKFISQNMTVPFIRSAIHYTHQKGKKKDRVQLIKSGICKSGGFQLCPNVCKPQEVSSLQRELFKFSSMKWLWDKRCFQVQKEHYKNVLEKYHKMINSSVALGCKYLAGK